MKQKHTDNTNVEEPIRSRWYIPAKLELKAAERLALSASGPAWLVALIFTIVAALAAVIYLG